jgi:hypothetical protein
MGEKSEKADQMNRQARGRADALGQNKVRTFVNDAGETVEGTMNDFHATLKDQGYRQADDAAETTDEAAGAQ